MSGDDTKETEGGCLPGLLSMPTGGITGTFTAAAFMDKEYELLLVAVFSSALHQGVVKIVDKKWPSQVHAKGTMNAMHIGSAIISGALGVTLLGLKNSLNL